jgi:enoyl-CoA hydratase/carnithine racemase
VQKPSQRLCRQRAQQQNRQQPQEEKRETMDHRPPEVKMTIEGHICVISLDNSSKKNAITPDLMSGLSKHLTSFEADDDLWVAVLDPAGEHLESGERAAIDAIPSVEKAVFASEDFKEGIQSFVERREAPFQGR